MTRDDRFLSQQDKVLFVATVYTHLAAFHVPFLRLLRRRSEAIGVGSSARLV